MITKVTRDVLDATIRPITDGLDINGDGTASFSIDGTIIGANLPAAADFSTVAVTSTLTASDVDASTSVSAPTGNFNTISPDGNSSVALSVPILVNPGSAATPSLASTGDPNTGLYWDAGNTNALKVSNSGINTWTIEADGDLVPNGTRDIGSSGSRVANMFATSLDVTNGVTAASTSATTSLAGLVELATVGEAFGSSSTVAITPSALGGGFQNNRVLTTNGGYQILPGGVIMQWGRLTNVGQGSFVVTLPAALSTTNAATVVANPWVTDRPGGGSEDGHGGLVISTTQIRIWHRYDAVMDISWLVMGQVSI